MPLSRRVSLVTCPSYILKYVILTIAIMASWQSCNSQNDENSSGPHPPNDILQMDEPPEEKTIDWKAMDDSDAMAKRRRRLGQCAQGGDDCAPSRWNVLKLVVDGSYMSIRRVSPACNLVLPQGPVIPAFVNARCGVNIPQGQETIATYQTGDVLIGTNFPSSDEAIAIDFSLGNNNIFAKTGTTAPIGMSFQNCIMAQSDFTQAVPLNTWTCLWNFAFSDGMTNQIMASGTYFNQTRSSSPRLQNPPKYQIISITGGTGMFNRIKGFVILTPLDLTARPPKWWYYVVYKDVWH